MSDTYKYYAAATGADMSNFKPIFRGRVLVPFVARPFAWFAQRYLPGWDAGFFGLLVANALFCATTACLIVSIGVKVLDNFGTALLGATLYLLNFAISNFQLSGLIDSGEACFMAAVVWSLLERRAYLLPLIAPLGAAAKETFVPFATVFALTWWWIERRQGAKNRHQLKWIIALAVIGLTIVSAIHSAQAGQLRLPWQIASQAQSSVNFFGALVLCLTERNFWYVFGWLVPLGVWRLKHFPKQWLVASVTASLLGLMLGAYINAGGTIARATFDIVGPLLSLSVAVLISRPLNSDQ